MVNFRLTEMYELSINKRVKNIQKGTTPTEEQPGWYFSANWGKFSDGTEYEVNGSDQSYRKLCYHRWRGSPSD